MTGKEARRTVSLAEDGRRIYCDGEGCAASARPPVALHPVPGTEEARMARGWLFVTNRGREWHFCPRCSPERLRALPVPDAAPATPPASR